MDIYDEVIERFAPGVSPKELEGAIEEALA